MGSGGRPLFTKGWRPDNGAPEPDTLNRLVGVPLDDYKKRAAGSELAALQARSVLAGDTVLSVGDVCGHGICAALDKGAKKVVFVDADKGVVEEQKKRFASYAASDERFARVECCVADITKGGDLEQVRKEHGPFHATFTGLVFPHIAGSLRALSYRNLLSCMQPDSKDELGRERSITMLSYAEDSGMPSDKVATAAQRLAIVGNGIHGAKCAWGNTVKTERVGPIISTEVGVRYVCPSGALRPDNSAGLRNDQLAAAGTLGGKKRS